MVNPGATHVPKNDDEKKKKRNRKKKAKKDDKSSGEKASVPSTVVPMNPHTILRDRLAEEGFSVDKVDKAMEEMWDKNMAYDQFEAVLKYLRGEKESPNDDKVAKGEKSQKIIAEKDVDSEASKGGVVSTDDTDERLREPTPKATTVVMTMEQRLDMVANFENLTDAIFALTEWVTKAAKPADLEDLCAATKTQALITIFHRSITTSKDQKTFDKAILPSMIRLMDGLLGKSGISPVGLRETQSAFEPLLRKARSTYLLQQPDADDFAARVSHFIVSRISFAIGESNASSASPVNGNHSSSTSCVVMNGSADSDMATMLSEREIHMTASKRYGAMTSSVCVPLAPGGNANIVANGVSARDTEISTSDVMLALVGEDAKTSFELRKAELDELQNQVKKTESEAAQELRGEMEEIQTEREAVAQRILELKKSIEKLETYDAELCVKVNDTKMRLDEETAQSSAEATGLNEKIKEVSEALKYGSRVIEVANILKKYDDSLDKAIVASSQIAATSKGDQVEFAGKQMEIYLTHTLKYFESEVKIIDTLNKRVVSSTQAVDELKNEIIELDGLGMTTTIDQMKESVERKEAMIVKDAAMIKQFTEEARVNFDRLINQLHDYRSAQSANALQVLSSTLLGSLRVASSKLKLPAPERLDLFINSLNVGTDSLFFRPLDPIATNTAMNGTSDKVAKAFAETAPAPKLTWATSKLPSNAIDSKASLLDIQKEERKIKDAE